MSTSLPRAYQMKWRPIILRDLISCCNLTQSDIATNTGLHRSTVNAIVTRGYRPIRKPGAVERINNYVAGLAIAGLWMRAQRITLPDIWKPSVNSVPRIYPANHGRRYDIRKREKRLSRWQKQYKRQKERRRRFMENGLATLAAYGYRQNPFDGVRIRTGDGEIFKRLFNMCVSSNAMVSLIAPWGAGKTTAIEAALEGFDAHVLRMISADKERLGIHDVERAIVKLLSPSESIPRSREVRAHQVRRVMGEAQREKPVILILEEAHCLHHSTLRALKRVREYEWMGKRPLLSVVLIGQFDKLKSGNLEEVRLRADTYRLKGLAPSEAARYIYETVGDHFEDAAVKAISELPVAKNFLELQESLITLMDAALRNGAKTVSVLDVFTIYGGGIKQLMDKYDIKLSKLAELTGEDKTALSLIINNKPHTLSNENETRVRTAITDALKNLIPGEKRPLREHVA